MKGALLVGINNYPGPARLNAAVNDATVLASLLEKNEDGSKNFFVELKKDVQSRAELRSLIIRLFKSDLNTVLFYFAGHGCINERGGFFVTPDFKSYDEGISMDEVLNIVNQSKIKEKIVIIDCCHAGALGVPVIIGSSVAHLGEGVTIMSATRSSESAMEADGHGLFTSLLISALKGGAADVAGNITPGSIYTYIDRSLGFWEQRPLYKANVCRFTSLRNVQPVLHIESLRKITSYFEAPEKEFQLDPSYEYTNTAIADSQKVLVFKDLQKMNSAGLVVPVGEEHMYWAAMNSKTCKLTNLGGHYWKLVQKKRI